jgi:hypothetical protein
MTRRCWLNSWRRSPRFRVLLANLAVLAILHGQKEEENGPTCERFVKSIRKIRAAVSGAPLSGARPLQSLQYANAWQFYLWTTGAATRPPSIESLTLET